MLGDKHKLGKEKPKRRRHNDAMDITECVETVLLLLVSGALIYYFYTQGGPLI